MPFRGTVFTLFVTTTLFLIVVLGIGYLISVLIRSQVGASQIALLVTMLPTTLLSGYVFPIDQMPQAVQDITYLVYRPLLRHHRQGDLPQRAPVFRRWRRRSCSWSSMRAAVMLLAARAFRKRLD